MKFNTRDKIFFLCFRVLDFFLSKQKHLKNSSDDKQMNKLFLSVHKTVHFSSFSTLRNLRLFSSFKKTGICCRCSFTSQMKRNDVECMAQVLTSIRFNRLLIFVYFLCNYISNKKKQVLNAYHVLHLKSEHDNVPVSRERKLITLQRIHLIFLCPCIKLYKRLIGKMVIFALIFLSRFVAVYYIEEIYENIL